ncbi:hypothetical protein VTN77DRAFT_1230 [Rasamsonia byssochlamydoides]|uniref:uncharacterized protein n=1 Tax=Rasamsonia byssochlamydoides TaxID=89139 RepID=UPI003742E6AF
MDIRRTDFLNQLRSRLDSLDTRKDPRLRLSIATYRLRGPGVSRLAATWRPLVGVGGRPAEAEIALRLTPHPTLVGQELRREFKTWPLQRTDHHAIWGYDAVHSSRECWTRQAFISQRGPSAVASCSMHRTTLYCVSTMGATLPGGANREQG